MTVASATAVESDDLFMTEDQAATLLAVSPRTLQGWRVRGGGPKFSRAGRLVRYRRGDLLAWMASRTVASTSDRGKAA